MCGRLTLAEDHAELEGRFQFKAQGFEWAPRYNVAPTQPVLAVLGNGGRRGEMLRWGLVPSWAKDPGIGSRLINARAETVAEKPAFRQSLRSRRCLVLADGFYEWKHVAGKRVPMRIVLKTGEAFAFAGLWDDWRSHSHDMIRSCTIITTTANTFLASIHDRMPVILDRDSENAWLDPAAGLASLTRLLAPYRSEDMDAYPVSTVVNSPRNDTPECIARLPVGLL